MDKIKQIKNIVTFFKKKIKLEEFVFFPSNYLLAEKCALELIHFEKNTSLESVMASLAR